MSDVQEALSRLSHSPFRSRIRLQGKELHYLRRKGLLEVLKHAADFIEKRLASASPANAGNQTPWHNHPVFVAQHATATCCRGCLQKWHQIPKGRALTSEERQSTVELIGGWLSQEKSASREIYLWQDIKPAAMNSRSIVRNPGRLVSALGSSAGKGKARLNDRKRLEDALRYWDDIAPSLDDEPDRGLHGPLILEHWTNFLQASLPYTNSTILDIGCGTGSLSVVLAGLGHKVIGIDLSLSMITLARMKAETLGFEVEFHAMGAASPRLPHKQFDAIVCRHLLWALPELKELLQKWVELLKDKGRLILIEGYWGIGSGFRANEIIEILPASFTDFSVQNLSDNSNLWGKDVTDEPYAIIADINR